MTQQLNTRLESAGKIDYLRIRGNPGRTAGFLYLLLVLAGPLRVMIIPSLLFVPGNAIGTANNIAANELLFRLGIVSDLFSGTIGLFLVLALYQLFKGVDRRQAVLMVFLGGPIVTTLYFVNALNDVAALLLAQGTNFLSISLTQPQLDAFAMLFLRLHDYGNLVNGIFWGLWLFPLGILVYRSNFLPRILGIVLFINGSAYLAASLTGLLTPAIGSVVSSIVFPALLGEIVMTAWLLIKGVNVQSLNSPIRQRASV